ncbi:MAG: hypothetical protein A3F17_01815 [Gammaproteobacteria bacterium RIFCSPHIGHO2_12_FULL_41_15]|nr:MAG: hypothetical protein A3F17_01815 [Gammaproteobacteria bacterium RIFCSPHIGHO2_12_FULL_41_15]
MILTWIIIYLLAASILAAKNASSKVWGIGFGVLLLLMTLLTARAPIFKSLSWLVFLALYVPLGVQTIRQTYITKKIFAIFKKTTPNLSETERQVLESGEVSWEREIFTGQLNWQKLSDIPKSQLSNEEQAFLDGPVTELCRQLNDFDITHNRFDLPEHIWEFLKREGFFGLIIPKRYGGKEFSALAHAQIIAKISTRSTTASTTASVPNSLGPAELLLHYGTEEQKNYYLPRLAKGVDIPCFALTSPIAGSDASSIIDSGVVCERVVNDQKQLGMLLNWDKRYITLAPVATVLGLAFKLYDPDHLLGDKTDLGITCALIPTNTKGVEIGRRHLPLNSAFQNGPTCGKNVFVPLDCIIGGAKMAGKGWQMLMDCLAVGRAISIPSGVIGGAMMLAATTGAYARIRKQFKTPIGQFGGVAEALARILGYLYLADATRQFTVSAIDRNEASAIASAIGKYHASELCRFIVNDVMDILGGKGICLGPNNFAGRAYEQVPIGITVEGANILTRSMIIFGQGAVRAHPYVLAEMKAATEPNEQSALAQFDQAFFAHLGMVASNKVRSFVFALTDANFIAAPSGPLKRYRQHLSHYCAAFAFLADSCMMYYGGSLKRKEQQSARLGDLLSYVYMGCAVLKFYEDRSVGVEDLEIVKWVLNYLFVNFEQKMHAIICNIPSNVVRISLKFILMPLGFRRNASNDKLTESVARKMLSPNVAVDRLCDLLDTDFDESDILSRCRNVMIRSIAVEPLEKQLEKAIKEGKIQGRNLQEYLSAAVKQNILNADQEQELLEVHHLKLSITNVDDFAFEELTRVFLNQSAKIKQATKSAVISSVDQ